MGSNANLGHVSRLVAEAPRLTAGQSAIVLAALGSHITATSPNGEAA